MAQKNIVPQNKKIACIESPTGAISHSHNKPLEDASELFKPSKDS